MSVPKSGSSFQGVSPILLSSSCDVLTNNSAIPNIGQLSYPFRKAIIIEEIRWTMRTGVNGGNKFINSGSVVSTHMSLGQNYLMRDPVPVWLLGTLMAADDEVLVDQDVATPVAYGCYRWRLPQPLYVEAGQVLSCRFMRGNDSYGSINVQVTYVGKTVAPNQPKPGMIAVPYAASWVTTLGNTYQQSNENHLFNPFDKPLHVQRLTGRVVGDNDLGYARQIQILTPATAGSDMTVLINDSWGGKMVNNNTGPSDVFDAPRAAWTVDTLMPPKGIYEIRAWNMNTANQLHVAMIGTREERT